jgi:hypothetical protein
MQTDLNQCMGELVEQLPWISEMDSDKVAHGGMSGALVGSVYGPKWPQVFLSCPLVSMSPYLSPFSYFCSNFLHTNKSPCTCGTRWIIKQILHIWCCFFLTWLSFWVKCWWSKWVIVITKRPWLWHVKGADEESSQGRGSAQLPRRRWGCCWRFSTRSPRMGV